MDSLPVSVMPTHILTCAFQTHASAPIGLHGTFNRVNRKLFRDNFMFILFKDFIFFLFI